MSPNESGGSSEGRSMHAHLKLQHSESVVVQVAGQIYAAYIVAGRVSEGEEDRWMKKSIREAIRIALTTDQAVISDDEMMSDESLG